MDGRPDRLRLRIGDAERDAVTSALHEHFAQGRLDRDELEERLNATLSAKTFGDLEAITADLPGSGLDPRAGHSAAGPGPWGDPATGARPAPAGCPGAGPLRGRVFAGAWVPVHGHGRHRAWLLPLLMIGAIVAAMKGLWIAKVVLVGLVITFVMRRVARRRGRHGHRHRHHHSHR